MYGLPFNDTKAMKFTSQKQHGNAPVLRKGSFSLSHAADTYLDLSHWGKGVVWVNGHNLGRYWNVGPQQTLYLPGEWLKKGNNEIVVMELLNPDQTTISAIDKPILDQTLAGS